MALPAFDGRERGDVAVRPPPIGLVGQRYRRTDEEDAPRRGLSQRGPEFVEPRSADDFVRTSATRRTVGHNVARGSPLPGPSRAAMIAGPTSQYKPSRTLRGWLSPMAAPSTSARRKLSSSRSGGIQRTPRGANTARVEENEQEYAREPARAAISGRPGPSRVGTCGRRRARGGPARTNSTGDVPKWRRRRRASCRPRRGAAPCRVREQREQPDGAQPDADGEATSAACRHPRADPAPARSRPPARQGRNAAGAWAGWSDDDRGEQRRGPERRRAGRLRPTEREPARAEAGGPRPAGRDEPPAQSLLDAAPGAGGQRQRDEGAGQGEPAAAEHPPQQHDRWWRRAADRRSQSRTW